MRIPLFEEFPPPELKRISVQKIVNKLQQEKGSGPSPKVYCLTNYTLYGLETFLRYHLLKKGLSLQIEFSDYNVVAQTLLDDDSKLYSSQPDFVLLSLDLRNFVHDFSQNLWSEDDALKHLMNILNLLKKKVHKPVLLTNFISPLAGDRRVESSFDNKVDFLNQNLMEFVDQNTAQFFLVDMNRVLALTGVQEALDIKLWYQSKAPFKSPFLSRFARDISTIVGAHYGVSKKCILLDCDNTLWGGVIGEDGLSGIALDPNDYPGVAYYEFQAYLLNLHNQGVLLAICSKNNENDVFRVLDEHPHCLLKREHFCCIKANWDNKVDNILEIASRLQLGLNNFVFIDDNPVECSMVEQYLPDLDISQAPENPIDFQYLRQAENIFFKPHFTEEDTLKIKQYKQNEQRQESSVGFTDQLSFLRSLDTRVEIFVNTIEQVERIAQLTQKTNQFNVRTKRYTVQDITCFMQSPKYVVFSMRVADKFGDLGITNVCIMEIGEDNLAFVDTFLMSCRAIKRDLEFFFFDYCLNFLKKEYSVTEIRAEYIPTDKNVLVKNFWESAGLTQTSIDENGYSNYSSKTDQIIYVEKDYIRCVEK